MNSSEKIKVNVTVIIKFIICRNINGYEHDKRTSRRFPIPENMQRDLVKSTGRMRKAASLAEQQLWYNCINSSWQFGFTVHQLLSWLAILPSAGKPMC